MNTNTEQMTSDLQSPSAYPEETSNVELIQTHISWVFICDDFVYKLKKPVDFGFLDFTTLEKRKYYCEKEVELNSRMAKDVYLGVHQVVLTDDKYKINPGIDVKDPIEYAVKMRILPDEALMKSRFIAGNLTFSDIDKIAKTIAHFHSIAEHSSEINRYGGLESVKFNTDENFQQTEKYIGRSISQEQFDKLKSWTVEFYEKQADLFEKRIQAGKVRDCHGDLHMEHVCMTEPIILIDCIEFNDRFRYSDTASDLAFLLMDLDYHGGHKFAEHLYKSYINYSGELEENLEQVMTYYKVYRAYVRGKVNSFRLGDRNIDNDKKEEARRTAQKYFELAMSYIN
jgi:aminoglycoside phosphotransferase family enzyme